MAGTKEYIEQFGSLTFDERPFCDGDAIAFCEIVYLPFERLVSASFDSEPVSFSETGKRLCAEDKYKLSKIGLMIAHDLGKKLTAMADSKRYADMKIAAFRRFYSTSPAVQFAAGTFILPDGTLVVAFQGTDDTIAGWKEDLDLFVHKGSPAYQYAIDFINDTAAKYDGKIILLGHSKGGHEALYTALKCSQEIRDRIICIYNNDGPGFYNHSFFKTGTYDEILDRYKHFVPSSSLIGMMMAHDYDYKAVRSTKHLGAFQHDMGTWYIDGGNLVTVPDNDIISKVTDVFLAKLIERTSDVSLSALDSVMTDIIKGSGQETLTGLAKNITSAAGGAVKAWKKVEPDVKKAFTAAFKGSGKLISDSIKTVKSKNIKEETETAFALV